MDKRTDVEAIVREVFKMEPLQVQRMKVGRINQVFSVTLPCEEVIVRINENPDVLKGTSRNITILGELGIPVPQVITEDLTGAQYPFHYMILKKIPGRDLYFELKDMTQSQMTTLAETIVVFQQKVAQLPLGTGYGWVPVHDKGEFNRWTEIIHRDVHNGLHNVQGVLSAIEIGRIEQRIACLTSYLDGVRPICFLDDVTTKNVIMQNGILQGIVDLDCVCYGDPLYMIALTKTAIVADGLESKLYYIDALVQAWELTDEQKEIVDVYALVHAMNFLEYFAHDERGYQRMLSFVKACIASLH